MRAADSSVVLSRFVPFCPGNVFVYTRRMTLREFIRIFIECQRPSSKHQDDGLFGFAVWVRRSVPALTGGALQITHGGSDMEFQQLEMFAAIVEEGTITQAAERVCRTAPALSIAIRKLEQELGMALFDRSERHQQKLTGSGRVLYSYAAQLLQLRREAISVIKDPDQPQTLRLGTHESVSLYLLPSLMETINARRTQLKIEVVCGSTDYLLRALNNRTIELAVMGDAPDDEKLVRHLITRSELVLVTSPSHRLAGLEQVRLNDLAGEFLIVQGRKSKLRARITEALHKSGTPFNVGVENVAIEAIKRLVSEGSGVGFVPRMCVTDEVDSGRLAIVKVNDLRDEWKISLVYHRDRSLSAGAQAFIEGIRRTIDESVRSESTEPNVFNSRTRKSIALRPRKAIYC